METRAPSTPDAFRFRCPVEVRFRDLDAMGHVNNAVYFSYFEIARAGYLRAIGHWPEAKASMTERFPFILLGIECQYLAPATLDDRLTVHLRTCRLGTKSFEFDYLIVADGERPIASGHSVQVFYDYQAGQTRPLPDWLRRKIEDYEG